MNSCIEVLTTDPRQLKHSVRYNSLEPRTSMLQNIYLTKRELLQVFGKIPTQIKITVEEGEE